MVGIRTFNEARVAFGSHGGAFWEPGGVELGAFGGHWGPLWAPWGPFGGSSGAPKKNRRMLLEKASPA